MALIQGSIGHSLARIYDTVATKLNLKRIYGEDVGLTHDMGWVAFSEAFRLGIRTVAASNVAQSTAFGTVTTDLPEGPFRIMGIQVICETTTTVSNVTVSARRSDGAIEFPLFIWDATSDIEVTSRFNPGPGTGDNILLMPTESAQVADLPVTLLQQSPGAPRIRAANVIDDLSIRGTTTAFGAGSVDVTAIVFLALLAGPNSEVSGPQGIPFPSW